MPDFALTDRNGSIAVAGDTIRWIPDGAIAIVVKIGYDYSVLDFGSPLGPMEYRYDIGQLIELDCAILEVRPEVSHGVEH